MKTFSEWVSLNEGSSGYEYGIRFKPKDYFSWSGGKKEKGTFEAHSRALFASNLKNLVKELKKYAKRVGHVLPDDIEYIWDYQNNKKIRGEDLEELLNVKISEDD